MDNNYNYYCFTGYIGHDVIADYHGNGKEEPKDGSKDILNYEVRLWSKHEHGEVGPSKLCVCGNECGVSVECVCVWSVWSECVCGRSYHAELYRVEVFLQTSHKQNKTWRPNVCMQ